MAKLRLRSLPRELEKFDDPEDDSSQNDPGNYDYSGRRRRSSDDGPDGD
jgi:hypothetical protein